MIINKLLDVLGSNIACGYDIGCAFSKTLMDSRLAEKARELCLRMVVGAFHGHSHNRGCQLDYHPLYIDGTGRADYEGCERVFHLSNKLAPGTRHASKFCRQQAVEEHFAFWDEDKYAALGLSIPFWSFHILDEQILQGHFYLTTIVKHSLSSRAIQLSSRQFKQLSVLMNVILSAILTRKGNTFPG